jgi:hypothetical protein
MARILIYQPLSYFEGYLQFDLSWFFLFDHVINLFPPLEPALNCDDFFYASLFMKQAGLLSDSMDELSSKEMDYLYTVPKWSVRNQDEFSETAPARRFKKLMDAKRPKDSHTIYYASKGHFESDFTEGLSPLLKIAIRKFPIIDIHSIPVSEFIDFLREPETMAKKQAFCSIIDDIESWILNGEIDIHHVPDLISSRYFDYLNRIGRFKKTFAGKSVELVMTMSKKLLSGLSLLRPSPAVESLFSWSGDGIELSREEMSIPNGELAYIEHVNSYFQKPRVSLPDLCL